MPPLAPQPQAVLDYASPRQRGKLRLPSRSVLAVSQDWFETLRPWVDVSYAQGALFNGAPSGQEWAHIGVTGMIWLVIPLTVGVWYVMRSEVK